MEDYLNNILDLSKYNNQEISKYQQVLGNELED